MRSKRQASRSATTDSLPGQMDGTAAPCRLRKAVRIRRPVPCSSLLQTTGPGGTGTDTDWNLQAPGHHVFLPALLKTCGPPRPQKTP
ncbi:hypothetical protein NXF25_005765 [Crotalus adamanteus]|uniref:Uncharacterized protein n=1 Tax=Crotalus adamanteus TaxID=8729 RepID=A0AAW1BYI3_CROAD